MNPEPPALEASTIPQGYRGGGDNDVYDHYSFDSNDYSDNYNGGDDDDDDNDDGDDNDKLTTLKDHSTNSSMTRNLFVFQIVCYN